GVVFTWQADKGHVIAKDTHQLSPRKEVIMITVAPIDDDWCPWVRGDLDPRLREGGVKPDPLRLQMRQGHAIWHASITEEGSVMIDRLAIPWFDFRHVALREEQWCENG